MHLTPRQKEIFLYIEWYIKKNSISPSYDEIRRRFGFSSFNSVFKHIKQIEEKGVISIRPNKKRAITLTEHGTPSVHVRVWETIAVGEPIEAIENSIGGGFLPPRAPHWHGYKAFMYYHMGL